MLHFVGYTLNQNAQILNSEDKTQWIVPILPIGAGMTIALEVSKRYVVRWGLSKHLHTPSSDLYNSRTEPKGEFS
jgi:hypothetical protein